MKVLFVYSDPNCSCTLKSTFELSRGFSKYGDVSIITFDKLIEKHFLENNIIILQRLGGNGVQIPRNFINNLENWTKRHAARCRVIYTIDDLLSNSTIDYMCKIAHSLVLPNRSYDKYFLKHNKPIRYIHTWIDSDLFDKVEAIRTPGKFNILWASTAILGFTFMEKLIPEISKIPNVELTILGDTRKNFSRLGVSHKPIQPYDKLLGYFKGTQICLNPIDTVAASKDFCDCKSAIKYLHAGLARVPIISSRSFPYECAIKNKVNGILLDNEVDLWVQEIKNLMCPSENTLRIIDNAYLDVTSNFLLDNAGQSLYRIFQEELISVGLLK